MNPLTLGFVASLLAGLGTGVGALPVLLPINPTEATAGDFAWHWGRHYAGGDVLFPDSAGYRSCR